MNPDWQSFLATRSTGIDDDPGTGIATPRADAEILAADLSQFAIIRVDGADARTFLQGQLSTNLSALSPETGQFSSWSSPKGRVLTLLHVFLHDNAIHMALPHSLLAPIIKRLGMYVLRAKVTLGDVSEQLARFGLSGNKAASCLQGLGFTLPAGRWQTTSANSVTLMRLHGDTPRFACHGNAARIIELAAALDSSVRWQGEDGWALSAIHAGEPVIYPETSDQFVAQMLNLDALGGIDFKKGCYTGQEIIARAHYRGRVKRQLVRAVISGARRIAPATEIHSGSHAVGMVLDARTAHDGTQAALAVVQEEWLTNDTLTVGAEAQAEFIISQVYRDLSA